MRILFLASYFPPEIGSGSLYAFETAQAMAHFGHEVTVVTGFPSYHLSERPPEYRGRLWSNEFMNGIRVTRVVSQPLTRQSRIALSIALRLAHCPVQTSVASDRGGVATTPDRCTRCAGSGWTNTQLQEALSQRAGSFRSTAGVDSVPRRDLLWRTACRLPRGRRVCFCIELRKHA